MRSNFFTLVELLLVIAIIAILAAMLFPALNKAREHGKSTSCISKLKQIGIGIMHYTDDHNGFIPVSTNSSGKVYLVGNGTSESSLVMRLYKGRYLGIRHTFVSTEREEIARHISVFFHCPSDKVNYDFSGIGSFKTSYYSLIYDNNSTSSVMCPANTSRVRIGRDAPGRCIVFDMIPFPDITANGHNHLNLINALALGGHVKSVQIKDFSLTMQTATKRNPGFYDNF